MRKINKEILFTLQKVAAANPYDNQHFAYRWDRGFTDSQMIFHPPRTRECAVITASHRDFNNWKRSIFDMAHVRMITSSEFIHTNGNNNVRTRYIAITETFQCQGHMYDDYVITQRTNEILMRDFHDDYVINHINELINEVRIHIRQ